MHIYKIANRTCLWLIFIQIYQNIIYEKIYECNALHTMVGHLMACTTLEVKEVFLKRIWVANLRNLKTAVLYKSHITYVNIYTRHMYGMLALSLEIP